MPSGTGGSESDGNGVISILESRGVAPDIIREVQKALDAAGTFIPEQPPPLRNKKGEIDARHFQVRLANLANESAFMQRTGRRGMGSYAAMRDGILREAKLIGLDAKVVLEDRTVDDRGHELGLRICSIPKEEWSGLDDEIVYQEKAVVSAVRGVKEYLDSKEDRVREEAERIRRSGKAMLRRLERIRRLRHVAKNERPERTDAIEGTKWPSYASEWQMAWAASWVLRLMCYVYRTDRSDDFATDRSSIFDIGPHHCKMSADVFIAEHGLKYFVEGTPEECQKRPDIFMPVGKAGWKRGVVKCCGAIVQVAPRHGKSMFGTAWMVKRLNENPRRQQMMGHAVEEKCGENMRHVKSAFDRNEPQGRRNCSLFPSLRLANRDNDQWKMRLALDEPTRDPNIRAKGIMGGIGGGNADDIWLDDPVDPREVREPTKRDEVARRISHQWLRRRQSEESFVLITHTPWHPDDGVCRLVEQSRLDARNPLAEDEDSGTFAISTQPVGGPLTKPENGGPFFSIWDGQPSSVLRLAFKEMRDPWAYACQYEMNPTPDSARIVKQVALYVSDISGCNLSDLPEDDREMWVSRWEAHRDFLKTAKNHLSFDPTATSKERADDLRRQGDKTKRDMAGLVYVGVGPARESVRTLEDMVHTSTRIRIRVLDAKKFYCSPIEAIEELGNYAAVEGRRVDVVHVEEVTAFVAVSEGLRNKYGLTNDQVVGHKPQNLDKQTRLRLVSPMIDDSLRHKGLEPAVVEFPGVLNEDGVLIPDPGLQWFIDTILDFAFTKEKNCVDALTQVCKFLAPEVNVGGGAVTTSVRAAREDDDPYSDAARRRAHMMEDYRSEEPTPAICGETYA